MPEAEFEEQITQGSDRVLFATSLLPRCNKPLCLLGPLCLPHQERQKLPQIMNQKKSSSLMLPGGVFYHHEKRNNQHNHVPQRRREPEVISRQHLHRIYGSLRRVHQRSRGGRDRVCDILVELILSRGNAQQLKAMEISVR